MNNQNNVASFFLSVLPELKISHTVSNGVCELKIPTRLRKHFFNEEKIQVELTSLSPAHELIQIVSSLVSSNKPTYSVAIDPSLSPNETIFYFTFLSSASTYRSHKKVFTFSLRDEACLLVDDFNEKMNSFLPGNEIKLPPYSEKIVDEFAKHTHASFLRAVKEEENALLSIEIDRIQTYFNRVKQEHERSRSHASYDDYGIINDERENLLTQQTQKYRVDEKKSSLKLLHVLVTTPKK